jgi:regulator of protease activity HflC (stomatin/prohibitin superfamily)
MSAYVFDVLRSSICSLTLDRSFEAKDDISKALKEHLQAVMNSYGYQIHQTLVTDISPDSRVRDAMNRINESRRIKEASAQRAEGEKIVKVKRAEAEAESMYLSGVGVARSRKAIVDGLRYGPLSSSSMCMYLNV